MLCPAPNQRLSRPFRANCACTRLKESSIVPAGGNRAPSGALPSDEYVIQRDNPSLLVHAFTIWTPRDPPPALPRLAQPPAPLCASMLLYETVVQGPHGCGES